MVWTVARQPAADIGRGVTRSCQLSSSLRAFPESQLPSWSYSREGDPLTNGDFHYECKFPCQKGNFYSLVFRASPVSRLTQ